MHIGLIFAMQEELDAFLSDTAGANTHRHKNVRVTEVTLGEHTLFCVLSGVGKVNAAYATSVLIHHHDVKLILNSGVAGGLNVDVGTIVLSSAVVHHDVDVTAFGYDIGQIPGLKPTFMADTALLQRAEAIAKTQGLNAITGLIASGDKFVTDLKTIESLVKNYDDVHAIEMEAAAIAQVATLEGVPFLIIRAISDVIGKDAQVESFNTFLVKAAARSADLLKALLETR